MTTYVIGDVQGCFNALRKLLVRLNFNPEQDKMVFCGDLVNRGGKSLQTLRWIYSNQNCCRLTLGNHDLTLLAQYYVPELRTKNSEFKKVFEATDCANLMNWLLNQDLLLHLELQNCIVVHAGIYPKWSLKRAKKEAQFTMDKMRENPEKFFRKMFGSKPDTYSKETKGMDRARFAINCFTRMRFLYKDASINYQAKGEISKFKNLIPWFEFSPRKKIKQHIIFGHWSALGLFQQGNVICLDTGKVWGGHLTALKLPDKKANGKFKISDITQV